MHKIGRDYLNARTSTRPSATTYNDWIYIVVPALSKRKFGTDIGEHRFNDPACIVDLKCLPLLIPSIIILFSFQCNLQAICIDKSTGNFITHDANATRLWSSKKMLKSNRMERKPEHKFLELLCLEQIERVLVMYTLKRSCTGRGGVINLLSLNLVNIHKVSNVHCCAVSSAINTCREISNHLFSSFPCL